MNRLLVIGVGSAAIVLLVGCERTSDGSAIRAEASSSHVSSRQTTTTTESSAPSMPSDQPVYGVIPTTEASLSPEAVTCFPESAEGTNSEAVVVGDPGAPGIGVDIPEGWTASTGTGDVGLAVTGPDGMSATVTIAPTTLEPGAAFEKYADDAMGKAPISTLSVLPAELCEYSGQRLMGTWAEVPGQAVEYTDRIVHIWTNTKSYLVAIHVEAPSGAPGFDAAASVLTQDFSVVIP